MLSEHNEYFFDLLKDHLHIAALCNISIAKANIVIMINKQFAVQACLTVTLLILSSSACVFQASLSIWGWGGLGVVLFLITFGPFAIFYLAFYIFCFVGG